MNQAVFPENHIGDVVKTLRERRNLSQQELAEQIGVKQPMISHIENGKRFSSHRVVARLAAFFDVTIDSLYNGLVPEERETGVDEIETLPDTPVLASDFDHWR